MSGPSLFMPVKVLALQAAEKGLKPHTTQKCRRSSAAALCGRARIAHRDFGRVGITKLRRKKKTSFMRKSHEV